jgi:hypothetical protein
VKLNLNAVDGKFDELQSASGNRPKAGRGLVRIKAFNEWGGHRGGHEIEFEIQAWTDESSVGKIHKETIFLHDASRGDVDYCTITILCILQATGIITPADCEAARTSGTELELDTAALSGKLIFCALEERKDKKDATKSYTNVGSMGKAYYHIEDPRCLGWPVNQGILNQNAGKSGKWTPLTPAETAAKPAAANVFGNT